MLLEDPHFDLRHRRFIWQSIEYFSQQLSEFNTRILVLQGQVNEVLTRLMTVCAIKHIFSHQEIGLSNTFERDKAVSRWCDEHRIPRTETPCGAVIRGLSKRLDWEKN